MARSKIENLRIPLSWLYALTVVAVFALSASRSAEIFSSLLFSAGLFLIAIATVGRLWCSLYISGYKSRQLVADGPYSVCRNPLYFFSLIGVIGLGLSSEMLTILALLLLPYAIYYPLVIRAEERKLLERFGSPYAEYLRSTPRFLPRWQLLQEPATYQVNPQVFRKQLFDAVWFVWLAGGLEFIEELHELNILPTYFHIF